MLEHTVTINSSYLASVYGSDAYGANTYNGETNTSTNPGSGTTAPGTPNTGFFQSAFSGANEASLIPIILVIAVAAGAITIGVRKMLRKKNNQ